MHVQRSLVLGGGYGVFKTLVIQSPGETVEDHGFLVVLRVYDRDFVSWWQDM